MSIKPIELPHWPSGPAIREEQRIAAAQRRLYEEAVKLWGSGSPCERPWRPDTGLLNGPDAQGLRSRGGLNTGFPGFPPGDDYHPEDPGDGTRPWSSSWCGMQDYRAGYADVGPSSDVFPATGRGSGDDGPDVCRIMLAVSNDGLTWRRTNIVVADRADVPSMIWDPNTERFWMFFQIFDAVKSDGTIVNSRIVAAVSGRDTITEWTFRTLLFEPDPGGEIDPCVVHDEANGRYLLYFARAVSGMATEKIHVATAEKLRDYHWDFEVLPAFANPSGQPVQDPVVVQRSPGSFEMFAWGPGRTASYHLTSTNGLRFHSVGSGSLETKWEAADKAFPIMMSNGLPMSHPPYHRLYGFTQDEPDGAHRIVSLRPRALVTYGGTAVLARTWELDDGERLVLDTSTGYESVYVREAAVAQGGSGGCYLMAYVTEIPK